MEVIAVPLQTKNKLNVRLIRYASWALESRMECSPCEVHLGLQKVLRKYPHRCRSWPNLLKNQVKK